MLGALDMFSIGIGPSSSHTIGPMKAALTFINLLEEKGLLKSTVRLEINFFGSLALTGEGHGSMFAVINGLCGHDPKTVDPKLFIDCVDQIKQTGFINLNNTHKIKFSFTKDLLLHKHEFLSQHSNAMRFIAYSVDGVLLQEEYFSVGGGFVLNKSQINNYTDFSSDNDVPYPFKTANELFGLCKEHNISIATLVTRNELSRKTKRQVYEEASEIIQVMHESVLRGVVTEGVLPGGLNVRRRAPSLYKKLNTPTIANSPKEQRLLAVAYAMAVNEENAAFSRIVTAPTNGSAGTIPAVLEYYRNFEQNITQDKLVEFILTAGAIGMLYKYGASISAAEVGCQGEIGVACSMAAGALTAVLGGSLIQIEKSAEIGMEHNLGMTCDPVGGLVQVPCIERNGIASSKAIDISYLSLLEEEPGIISLDQVIKTMLQTGRDMSIKYKETSLGGLAVNIVNC